MYYNFPVIETIDDVLPSLKDHDEFVIIDRDTYTAIDYLVIKDLSTFSDPIRRECRGIKFNTDGTILARPYHKFFNVGERESTQEYNLDLSKKHIILDKMDGSMIHPVIFDDQIILMTRKGITDVAQQAQDWMNTVGIYCGYDYDGFCREVISFGYTPIFEWCSLDNRIVIPYNEALLILTGIRHNTTGKYVEYSQITKLLLRFTIPLVPTFKLHINNLRIFIKQIRGLKNIEGFVLRFNDGHMIKIKTDEYVLRHKTKDAINFEKHVLKIVVQNMDDDMYDLLSPEDTQALKKYAKDIRESLAALATKLSIFVKCAKSAQMDRKSFSIHVVTIRPKPLRSMMYQMMDGKNPLDCVYEWALKHTKTSSTVEAIRPYLGNITWEDYRND